ncbi:MAG: 50S ribosomal protein L11 methyltransferase [bacterium]|nr:50S ribosomal protein L11 methyltransferase [bacterium]
MQLLNYYEISLTACEPIDENVEIISAYLGEFGFEGSAEDEAIKAYRAENEITIEEINVLVAELIEKNLCFDDFKIEIIKPKNWNEEWEKNYFQPILIGDQCLIKSSFHTTNLKAKYEIIIDPKMSFGTGHHETTSMMVEYLLELDVVAKKVIDMGTGTGILGILASMLGAESIIGIDNDSWCYENAQENLVLNKVQNFEMRLGDAGLLKTYPMQFDIFIANINRHILLADIKYYVKTMKSNGILLLSGFYLEDFDSIKTECEKYNLVFESKKLKKNWIGAKFRLTT